MARKDLIPSEMAFNIPVKRLAKLLGLESNEKIIAIGMKPGNPNFIEMLVGVE